MSSNTTRNTTVKRKREELFTTSNSASNMQRSTSTVSVRKLKSLQPSLQLHANNKLKLLSSGDLISITQDSDNFQSPNENKIFIFCNVAFHQGPVVREDAYDPVQNFYQILQGQKPYHAELNISAPLGITESSSTFFADAHKDNESNTMTIIVSESGNIVLIPISQSGRSISSAVASIPLIAKNEKITCCSFLNSTIAIVGTSHDNVYILRCETLKSSKQEELKVTIEHLNKSTQTVFGMLLQNGAKLIGLVPDDSYQSQFETSDVVSAFGRLKGVMKLLPVPLSHLLLVVGYSTIGLWNNWINRGTESLLWEINVRKIIKADILTTFSLDNQYRGSEIDDDSVFVRLVDSCLLQSEPGASRAVILLLSVSIIKTEFRSYNALWLHTVELPLAAGMQSTAAPTIMHRLLVSRSIRFGGEHETPKICSLPPSWRVFLTWTDAQFVPGHIFCAQFDVLNQPILEDLRMEGGLTFDAFECKHYVDCGVDASSVVSMTAVKSLDGVCALLEDQSLLSFIPPLADRSTAVPIHRSNAMSVADRWTKSFADNARKENILIAQRLLWSICFAESEYFSVSNELRNAFTVVSVPDLQELFEQVSRAVIDWSNSSSDLQARIPGASPVPSKYTSQPSHVTLNDKVVKHSALLHALECADAFNICPLAKVKIVSDHYNLLFAAGLAEALQEAKRRGGSTAQGREGSTATLKPNATTNSISEFSHGESSQVLEEVFKDTIETKGVSAEYFFSAGYCQAHGLSFSEAVFFKPSLISIVVGNVASHIQKRYDQELAKRTASTSDSWLQLLQATYGVASLIVSAAKRCEQDPSFSTDVATIKQMRVALRTLLRILGHCITKCRMHLEDIFSKKREGVRLKDFCGVVLQNYVCEAEECAPQGQSDTADVDLVVPAEIVVRGEHMSAQWKAEYHDMKTHCVALFENLNDCEGVWALSLQYLYFPGLIRAAFELFTQPKGMQMMEELFKGSSNGFRGPRKFIGDAVGTDPKGLTLATNCFLWLEENNRPSDILALGEHCEPKQILLDFLKGRADISLQYHLMHGQYASATESAVMYANSLSSLSKAKTILSIGKLASKLISDPAVPVAAARALNKDQGDLSFQQGVQQTLKEMEHNLALIKVQEKLQKMCPSVFVENSNAKVHAKGLVVVVVHILLSTGDEEISNPDMDELVSCFGMGIALLSMQIEHLKAVEGYCVPVQLEALRNLAGNLWGAAVKSELQKWHDLAHQSHSIHSSQLQQTFFWAALKRTFDEVRGGCTNPMLLLCTDSSVMLGEDEKAFESFFPLRVDEIVQSLDKSSFQPQSEKRLSTLLTMCIEDVSR